MCVRAAEENCLILIFTSTVKKVQNVFGVQSFLNRKNVDEVIKYHLGRNLNTSHYKHWPQGLPYRLTVPNTSVYYNLYISALRFPSKTAVQFFDTAVSYQQLLQEVDYIAGFLQKICHVKKGDRVLLQMQNSPQYIISFYAILRADAVVVPVSPMLVQEELEYVAANSESSVLISSQDLISKYDLSNVFDNVLISCYKDYLNEDINIPEWLLEDRIRFDRYYHWNDAVQSKCKPTKHLTVAEDLACLPYTSGTTGSPKGCMHTHRSLMYNAINGAQWAGGVSADHITLSSLPFFHVSGMQIGMNAIIYSGSTMVVMPRWNRDLAGYLITKYRVTSWPCISTMVVDFLSNPNLFLYDVSSLRRISGGGAPMPAAIAERLLELTGLRYMEGYGLSETIGATHTNPLHICKQQCLGIPTFDVDSRIINPDTLEELDNNQVGEIIVSGPQLFKGYWQDDEKTAQSFIQLDDKQFFRTGDLGYRDTEGFYFFTDRLKRMINAGGLKVWPAEIEATLYKHSAVAECCIIAAKDSYRGETVKALIVLKQALTEDQLTEWCKQNMAAYKVPRIIEFVDSLPKSATGKIMWKQLQDRENLK